MDEKELIDKIEEIIKKVEDLNKQLTELSKWNEINNAKIEKLINDKKSRRKRK